MEQEGGKERWGGGARREGERGDWEGMKNGRLAWRWREIQLKRGIDMEG